MDDAEIAATLRRIADDLDDRKCKRCGRGSVGTPYKLIYYSSPKRDKQGLPWIGEAWGCPLCSDEAYKGLKERAKLYFYLQRH